jgi:glucose dehydrogenase
MFLSDDFENLLIMTLFMNVSGSEKSIFILSALLYLVISCSAWAEATQTKSDPQISEDEAYKIADDFAECAGTFYVYADITQQYSELKNTTTNFRNIANAWEYNAAYIVTPYLPFKPGWGVADQRRSF